MYDKHLAMWHGADMAYQDGFTKYFNIMVQKSSQVLSPMHQGDSETTSNQMPAPQQPSDKTVSGPCHRASSECHSNRRKPSTGWQHSFQPLWPQIAQ